MPVVFAGIRFDDNASARSRKIVRGRADRGRALASGCLEIGLLNNMPDAALQTTERQFIGLLSAAAEQQTVRLHFYSLAEIARGEAARSHMRGLYGSGGDLMRDRLDALIVTGAEPRTARLSDEPYWDSLAAVIDWAEHNTTSTIWSCLAAHAAVLHLDGIARQPSAEKCTGVFDCAKVAAGPLLAGIRSPLRVAHSRWNGLSENELTAHGYQVLTRSAEAGIDIFAKQWRSLFVYFQGHPEYDPDSLLREYRRDVGRFLRGERDGYPAVPAHYFDARTEQAMAAFRASAMAHRDATLLETFPKTAGLRWRPADAPRPAIVRLFRNWLALLARPQRTASAA